MKAKAFCDGSGNSDRIQGAGCILYTDNGERHSRTKVLPPYTTNNVGEYTAVLLSVQTAKELGVTDLRIFSDSQLIVNQVNGKWACRNETLRALLDQVHEEAQDFASVSIQWIPRAQNSEADKLVRKAIREAELAEQNTNNPFLAKR